MSKIKIALDEYPFLLSRNIGPNIFLKRLAAEFKKKNYRVTNRFNPFYDIGLFNIENKSFFNKPYVIRIGGLYFDKKNTIANTEKENAKILEGIKNSEGVIFVCDFTRKLTESLYGKLLKPYTVINNSVPTNTFSPIGENKRKLLNLNNNDFVIVASSSWRRHKRLEEIIVFFEKLSLKLSNLKLLILGEVKKKPKHNNRKVIFSGKINHNNLPSWYRTGNIFFHFAWIDHSPNTLVEAAACGLPSLCTNNGGSREIIERSKSGIVSNADSEYQYKLVDLYNPPVPNYNILEADFLKIYNNLNLFKNNINYNELSINKSAEKYLTFLKQIHVSKNN